jgi:hypothetical protein
MCSRVSSEGRFSLLSFATVFSLPPVHCIVHRCGSEGNTLSMPGEDECCTYLSFTDCTHCFHRSGQSFRGVFPITFNKKKYFPFPFFFFHFHKIYGVATRKYIGHEIWRNC